METHGLLVDHESYNFFVHVSCYTFFQHFAALSTNSLLQSKPIRHQNLRSTSVFKRPISWTWVFLRLIYAFLSAVAVLYACTATVLRLLLHFLSPFACSNRRFSSETKLSDRAVRWQRSVSQSTDRWTTFTLGGPRVWQQDLGITIQRSHVEQRDCLASRWNRESTGAVRHGVNCKAEPFTDYIASMYGRNLSNNVQCHWQPICKLAATYRGLLRSFHNGTLRRPWHPITL